MKALFARLNMDGYIALLVTMVLIASLLPAYGVWGKGAAWLADAGVVILFFLRGAAAFTAMARSMARRRCAAPPSPTSPGWSSRRCSCRC